MVDHIAFNLFITLMLAILIERIIDTFKHFSEFEKDSGGLKNVIASHRKNISNAKKQAEEIIDLYSTRAQLSPEDLNLQAQVTRKQSKRTNTTTIQKIATATPFELHNKIKVIPIDHLDIDSLRNKLFTQIASIGLGIIFAELLNIRLLSLFFAQPYNSTLQDILFSGFVIGNLSYFVTAMTNFFSGKAITIESDVNSIYAKRSETQPTKTSLKDYDGGHNKESLQTTNLRKSNPIKIVYHHTGLSQPMHIDSICEDLILNNSLTYAYHCIVLPDGGIEYLCRWDRASTDLERCKDETLSIAFHGNFECSSDAGYSNFKGDYGDSTPSITQLKHGGQLIALWCHLYNIPLNPYISILPHFLVEPTYCPGSNFPHEQLFQYIEKYYIDLCNPSERPLVSDFKSKPYIYCKESQ